jgi:hypothetical protein
MCTVVILRRPGHEWPLILAANRDEMIERAWREPARHWPDRPEVVAGMDEQAGGTWLGLNDAGVVAGILNRRHSLGPAPGKRSRGELVLDALDHADAADAGEALAHLDSRAYRAFNMVVADSRDAFWIRSVGEGRTRVARIPEGVSVLTAWDLNDTESSERTRLYLPRFRAAEPPDPGLGDWSAWESLLASVEVGPGVEDPNGAMHVVTGWGFGTVSSSLVALSRPGLDLQPVWRFARTWPAREPYRAVHLA